MIINNWKANEMLEVIRKGIEDKIYLCHRYIYGVLNRELISDPLVSR